VNGDKINKRHDKFAPYWAVMLVLLAVSGVSTTWVDFGSFWKGYVLDITGPAWNYILFRGLFTSKADNKWTRFFTPDRTFIILVVVCLLIETLQYFQVYEATYDPWDFLAYGSLLIPFFIIDVLTKPR
jgi:hypothetical protein